LKNTTNTSSCTFGDNVLYRLLKPFGAAFSDPKFPAKLLLKHVIVQKFLRFNPHVPWPVHWTSQIKAPENIERGTRNPGLSIGCYLDGRNGIIIGENTWIGPSVSIISMNHNKINYHKFEKANPVVIGANCWIGTGAIILPEVELGNHVVVAAGSVVTKSFKQDNILIGGNSAAILKRLQNYNDF
jgi:acetyltransferase-like isoleucine patch superfamily enzyme